jgi:aryl-alcohol dehydrogenase-like predicted oxidoreductase
LNCRAITNDLALVAKGRDRQTNQPIIEFLKTFGAKKEATPAQIALAWLMAQKPWIVPIPGTSNMDHLRENMGTVNVQLSPGDRDRLGPARDLWWPHGREADGADRPGLGE